MSKRFNSILLIALLSLLGCRSDLNKANEIFSVATQMEQTQNVHSVKSHRQLLIQKSNFTGPVQKVPTQEDLIKNHKVKTVKEIYDGGWCLSTYDKQGNKISEEGSSAYTCKNTLSYQFDKDGNVIEEKSRYEDGSTLTIKYDYNEEGKVIRKLSDSNGKLELTTFKYDQDLNTRIESTSTGIDKEFYDNRGLRVRSESYDENNKLLGFGEAKYDENGFKISETSYFEGFRFVDTFEYNKNGQLLKQHRTGILDVYFLFQYDDQGLVSSFKNRQGSVEKETVYEYTFY